MMFSFLKIHLMEIKISKAALTRKNVFSVTSIEFYYSFAVFTDIPSIDANKAVTFLNGRRVESSRKILY